MCSKINHKSPSVVVIADDLTGALDTGIQFANAGARTLTVTKPSIDNLSSYLGKGYDVIAIDASSRHMNGVDAANTVSSIVSKCHKTDSVLRGNIPEELYAFMKAAGIRTLPYIPSFPDLGRTVNNGTLYVDGKPLLSTGLGYDPFDKVNSDKIAELFEGIPAKVVDCLGPEYSPISSNEDEILIYDSSSNDELYHIADNLLSSGYHAFAGCAGFADALSKCIPFTYSHPNDFRLSLPILIICGSINSISKSQLSFEEKNHGTPRISFSEEKLSSVDYFESSEGKSTISYISQKLSSKGIFIIDTQMYQGKHSRLASNSGYEIASSLGELAIRLLSEIPHLGLFVIGGDTMLSFLNKLGTPTIEPVAEIEKGIVASILNDGNRSIPVISKSGGFGDRNLISRILDKYRGKKEFSL